MGAHFSVLGIRKIGSERVLEALRAWEHEEGDIIEVFQCPSGNVLFLTELFDAEGVARDLAQQLHAPVILFSFADDVVWSYALYTAAGLVDQFSSRPNYWTEEEDASRWAGNAGTVCEVWGGVSIESISHYLTNKALLSEEQSVALAYADDQALEWDAWQMCDFMRRLGLDYPIDPDGEEIYPPAGTARIETQSGRALKASLRGQAQTGEMPQTPNPE